MRRLEKFEDYGGFVEKFKSKKTTDDCYTPPKVYETVKQYVFNYYKLDPDTEVIRPFYPGGNYQSMEYPENAVVIDNPPFSILKEIKNYFSKKRIKFFIFAPHLTLFSGNDVDSICYVITDSNITYENGATIPTSFVTNMDDCRIRLEPNLQRQLKNCQDKNNSFQKYSYPGNVISPALLSKYLKNGNNIKFYKKDLYFIRRLDSQKESKKTIYGGGFFISAEKAKEFKEFKEPDNVIYWELSEREKEIINNLGKE